MTSIPLYEGTYSITEDGKIWSHKNSRWLKNRIDRAGYWKVNLCKSGIVKSFFVHRLVAITFIPNPDKLPQVNHIDSNPLNSRSDNLEWCTQSQNIIHAYSAGRMHAPFKGQKRPEILGWMKPYKPGSVPWNSGMTFEYIPRKRKDIGSLVCPICERNKRPSNGYLKDRTKIYKPMCDACKKLAKALKGGK